jgi:uncharacterized protein YacL
MTTKEALCTLIHKGNIKEMFAYRDQLDKKLFLLINLLYAAAFCIFPPANIGVFGFVFGLLMTPLMTVICYFRTIMFIYTYNWMYLTASIISILSFVFTMVCLHVHYQFSYSIPVVHEILQAIFCNLVGLAVAQVVSLPIKTVHFFLYDPLKFYFSLDIWKEIHAARNPVQVKKQEEEKKAVVKQQLQYETMNETQLQAELNLALKDERFEDAKIITELLKTKFP